MQHFYHSIILGMSGIVTPVDGRILFLPADSDCVHEVTSSQILVTGEASSSMQNFLQQELERRLDQAGGVQ
jgi:hypothetical protein